MQKLRYALFALLFFPLLPAIGNAQPPNDDCVNATPLGSLPTPNPCNTGPVPQRGKGAPISFNGQTNTGSTPSVPYPYMTGCQPVGTQAAPAGDVWYTFVASGTEVIITVAGLTNPNIGLWEGPCGLLVGRGCAVGSAGSATGTFSPLTPGATYFLQISGGDTNDVGNFNLTLQNNLDCATCLTQSSFTSNPPSQNGTYQPGTAVTFCYTIQTYVQISANWIHGIVPVFGSGWDLTTLTVTPPTSCDGQAQWAWYTNIPTPDGPSNGFFCDRPVLDGNPTNNFGDAGAAGCTWSFCWTVTTKSCPPGTEGQDLGILVRNYADGETGSWTSPACQQDPDYSFNAVLTCCIAPVMTISAPLCNGDSTGTATAVGQGGGPYNYWWTNSITGDTLLVDLNNPDSSTISNLGPGTYTVVTEDMFSACITSSSFTFNNPPPVTAIIVGQLNPSCVGLSNGGLSAIGGGGTAPRTLSWSNGPTTGVNLNIPAGTYIFTVTDANGCTAADTATLVAPPGVVPAIDSVHNVSCNGLSDGAAFGSATGGTPPYGYSWNSTPIQSTATATGLPAGTYVFRVTDNNGCFDTVHVTITEPPLLVAAIDSSHDVLCNGQSTGDAFSSASGGVGPYSYSWNSTPVQNTQNATGLPAGNYTVTVTDGNGCTATANVTIAQPPALVAAIDSSHSVSCNGAGDGDAFASATGGTAPYTFSWNTTPVQTGPVASNLGPGNYTVTVTDDNGCTATANVAIIEPAAVVVQIDSFFNVSCNGANDGSAYASATGGSGPLTYGWTTTPIQFGPVATGLGPGVYIVIAADPNGCADSASVVITEPPVLSIVIDSSHNPSCAGLSDGDAYATASGGTAPYTISWNSTPVQNGSPATGLPAGNYTATVTDANGCTATANVSLVAPSPLVAAVDSAHNPTCFGLADGDAFGSASGGTGPYSYSWNSTPVQNTQNATNLPAGTYTLTVTDANGCTATAQANLVNPPVLSAAIDSSHDVSCNGLLDGDAFASGAGGTPPYTFSWNTTPVQNTAAATGLGGGSYQVTITDDNGCTATANVVIAEPTALNLVMSGQPSTCGNPDGQAWVTVSGGTPAYSYTWNTTPVQSTDTAFALPAGTYQVVVTDGNGCQDSASVNIIDLGSPTVVIDSSHDVTCFGAADGEAFASATGGTQPYVYSWNSTPVQNTPTATGLPGGNYTVTLTDSNGCVSSANVTINEPTQLVAGVDSSHNPTCFGLTDGDAFGSASGGTGPYSYSWNSTPVQNTQNATNLPAGTYTLTVTDANGCTATAQANLVNPPVLSAAIDSSHDVSCNGLLDGDAFASGAGGTPNYTFSWNTTPVQNSAAATGLGGGSYQVTITDDNGCTATANVVIAEPTALNLVMSSQPSTCGNPDGQAWVTVSGGTPAYSYIWNTTPVQSTDTAFALAAGSYQVVVTDGNGCQDSASVNIIDLGSPTVVIDSSHDVTCFGAADGEAFASATGGTQPYAYSWNSTPVQNTPTATGLPGGNYTVTLTDSNGCVSSANVTINEPTQLVAAVDSAHNPTCFGLTDGDAFGSASGGTGPYSYSWNSTPVQNSQNATNLPAGTYTLTVTDANGCTATAQSNLINPAVLSAAIDSSHDVTCNGLLDGDAFASGAGGTPPYTFSWNTTPVQNTAAATGLGGGAYMVTITDDNGCTATANVVIAEPSALNLVMSGQPSTCGNPDGQAWVTVSGGTPPYSYVWNTTPVQSTDTAFALLAGSYQVVITDGNGCQDSASVNIIDLGSPTAVIDSAHDASCAGLANGDAFASATGGTAPYSFSWNTTPVQNTPNATGLAAGNYTVTVTDSSGCVSSANVTIGQPASVIAAIDSSHDASCNGALDGEAFASATGGTQPYVFVWNTTPTQAGPVATGLGTGTWQVLVTDSSGCQDSAQVTINQPTPVVAAIDSSHDALCNGSADGEAFASATGGTGPYGFVWNTSPTQTGPTATGLSAGSYQVVVTDNNGCQDSISVTIAEPTPLVIAIDSSHDATCAGLLNGEAFASATGGTGPYLFGWNTTPPQFGPMATGLGAGTYQVGVMDDNGCIDSTSVTISEPQPIALVPGTTPASCGNADGSAFVNASGGTGPFNYTWNTTPVQNTDSATGLAAGAYTVIVTDANGCLDSVQVNVIDLGSPTVQIDSAFDASCAGIADGSAFASASGGTGPISFSWNTTPVQNTANATGLAAGGYTVTVTDSLGCSASANVTIGQPASVVAAIDSSNNISCNGLSDGNAYASASGGTLPYSFVWNTTPTQNTASAAGIPAGTWQVVVTDSNGCQDSASVTLTEPTPVVAAIDSSHDASCFGSADGEAFASASGGTLPYTFTWNTSPVQNGPVANGLSAGGYQVLVVDSNGCSDSVTVLINEPTALGLTTDSLPSTCGNSDGQAWVTASGGTGPYAYLWNTTPTQSTDTAFALLAGSYQVLVTDANGCQDSAQVNVIDLGSPTVQIDSSADVSCFGGNDGMAWGSATGGSLPYVFSWNTTPVQNTATATGLPAGNYTLTVTDSNGCQSSANVTINQPTLLVVQVDSSLDVTCNGFANGSAAASASGGTSPYTFSWNTTPAQNTAMASGLAGGTYQVMVTDSNGCADSATVTIAEPTVLVPAIDSSLNATCNGLSDGMAYASASGATAPYTFTWNTTPVQNGAVASGLAAGTYTVTVMDSLGCTDSAQVTITQPAPLAIATGTSPSTCGNNDGSAWAVVSGGTTPYTYAWSTNPVQTADTAINLFSGNYTVIVTDSNGCVDSAAVIVIDLGSPTVTVDSLVNVACNGDSSGTAFASATGGSAPYTFSWNTTPAQTGAVATNLPAGTYIVTVSDTNNCISVDTVTISEPTLLVAAVDTTYDVSCFGGNNGMAIASTSGGVGPYSFLWLTNPNQTGDTASGLATGTYQVVVTDSNGCVDTASATINEPTLLVALIDTFANVNCNGGNDGWALVMASGGTPGYTYLWSDSQMTDTAYNLAAGTYSVLVTDSMGCTDTTSVVISEPTLLVLIIDSLPATCGNADGQAWVTASGATPPYTYLWNTGGTTDSLSGLVAGTYSVIVTDSLGCSDSISIIVPNLDAPVISIVDSSDVTCFGFNNGTALAGASGGNPPYSYTWQTTPVQNTAQATGLAPGTYTVLVTDSIGCMDSTTVTLTEPTPLVIALDSLDATCFGLNDGQAWVTASGGTPGYNYVWSDSQTTDTAFSLYAGIYGVVVTDANGCTDTGSVNIGEPPLVVAAFTSNPAMPANIIPNTMVMFTNASMNASSYFWDFGDGGADTVTNPDYTYLNTGQYCVTLVAMNSNGCADTVQQCNFTVQFEELIIPNLFTPNSDNVNDFFEIVGIEKYPNNKLVVYNRWGNLIYEKDQYDNSWDGRNIFNGLPLPDGGYVFIFKPGVEGEDDIIGSVVIFR
ncbi:MAG: gliding motility-associated C-terminal domain-containing protein [Bacteroidia bacterium]|nr:gliding motility-associated C-terminal domain-containing protein [Bacteroidia bacterium]